MAYVGNVSAFLVHALSLRAGAHLFNYADKPDFAMQELVDTVVQTLGRPALTGTRIPYAAGYVGGVVCDLLAALTGRPLPSAPSASGSSAPPPPSLRAGCGQPASRPRPPSAKP